MLRFINRPILAAVFLLCFVLPCPAGVIVKQNVSPGATNWPGLPTISTLANPATASVSESFNGAGGNTNLSQTFKVVSGDFTLQAISIYAGGGSGTGAGTNLVLKLFDLGNQTAPNPSPYTASILGGNLLGNGAGLSVSYTSQANGILEFDFTGADQLTLSNGHMYAFELTGTLNTTPVSWFRATNDTYSGGAAYRNQAWINGTSARDFALAVYSALTFDTNYPPVPFGIVYHIFTRPINGLNPDGANPAAGLVLAGGVLCGTTVNAGLQGAGTAFYLMPDATGFNAFRAFGNPPDAANPQGDLTISGNRFFGASFGGGTNGVGAVFAGQTNGSVSVLRSFSAVSADTATNSGGASPTALLVSAGGTVFGTTTAGGAAANGTVYSVSTNGAAFSVPHDFSFLDSVTGTNSDGALPWSGLVLSGDALYGTTSAGGSGGNGVVFSVKTNGSNFTILHNFIPMDSVTATNSDGAIPFGGLVLSNDTLYGTTFAGGQGGRGTIFSIQTNRLGFMVLHHFSATDPSTGTNADGAAPCATLTMSGNVLYGTASAGGTGASGAIYSVKTDGTQFKTHYSFAPLNSSTGTNSDGAFPVAGLLIVGNSLYGTAFSGGPGSVGTLFRLPIGTSPAIITKIILNPDRTVTLFFLGAPGSTNIIQATTNLGFPTAWQNVSTNVADAAGTWQFTEAIATNSTRFYRSYAP
jgi:uncharacterized repeat protein (TIGR03803 family)